jgi:hypothetical protein
LSLGGAPIFEQRLNAPALGLGTRIIPLATAPWGQKGGSAFFQPVSDFLAGATKFRFRNALQALNVDGMMASEAAPILVFPDAKERPVDLMHLLNIPLIQTIKQVDPALIGYLVEPIGILLDLFLLLADMLQSHKDLVAALSQLIEVLSGSDFVDHHELLSVNRPAFA